MGYLSKDDLIRHLRGRVVELEGEKRELFRAIPGADTTEQFVSMAQAMWRRASSAGDVEAELRDYLAKSDAIKATLTQDANTVAKENLRLRVEVNRLLDLQDRAWRRRENERMRREQ